MNLSTPDTASSQWLPVACLILAMFLWGSSFIALKIAFTGYHPMIVIFGRMAVASICFLPFLTSFKNLGIRKSDIKYLLLMSVFEPCLYFIFEAKAIENTTASQAGVITALLPLLVAITAWLVLREEIGKTTIAGFTVAIVGACWLSLASEQSESAPAPLLGNFYEFLAMLCAAGYTVTLKHLTSRFPVLFLTASQAFIGSAFFSVFLFSPDVSLPQIINTGPTLAIVYLGIIVTILAYGLYNFAVSRVPANQAAAFVNLIPVFSIILGILILNEQMLFQQWLACGTIFCGLAISYFGAKKTTNSRRFVK
jgi:drug/metabolite transporter (DMT)-like permease